MLITFSKPQSEPVPCVLVQVLALKGVGSGVCWPPFRAMMQAMKNNRGEGDEKGFVILDENCVRV